jgi:hypothetical protein
MRMRGPEPSPDVPTSALSTCSPATEDLLIFPFVFCQMRAQSIVIASRQEFEQAVRSLVALNHQVSPQLPGIARPIVR